MYGNPFHPPVKGCFAPRDIERIEEMERIYDWFVSQADQAYERGEWELAERWDVDAERAWLDLESAMAALEETEQDDPTESPGLQHELARVYNEYVEGGMSFPHRGEITLPELLRGVLSNFDYQASQRVSDDELVEGAHDAWEDHGRLLEAYRAHQPPAQRQRRNGCGCHA